jgi:ribonuclease Z
LLWRSPIRHVIKYGAGADLLVHEVAIARPELMKEAYVQRIIGHHTTPREAGRVFAQTKPKLAAYTHLVLLGSEQIPPPTEKANMVGNLIEEM